MVSKQSRSEIRVKKHVRLRNRFSGTAERPRLAVFRSNNHMYAQIIDDTVGKTLVAASTAETGTASNYSFLKICSTLAWGLGYFGMPHILLRFMAIEDEKKLKLSRRVASIWVVISLSVAVFIGIVGYGMSKAGALSLPG